MEEIVIDNVKYDCYFILGVTPDDTVDHIQKTFKKKAKMLHPDKMSDVDKKDKKKVEHRRKHFNILTTCYNHLMSKKQSFMKTKMGSIEKVKMSDTVPTKQFDNDKELNVFNKEFERLRVTNPNDFGYEVSDRLTKVEDYDTFNYAPCRQFNSGKHFNQDEFNKLFEYNQQNNESNSQNEGALVHKTTDGFYGYNTADFGNAALVSSYNGLMIVGDNFGNSGVGYSDTHYSDYKKSFSAPKNPDTKLHIPTEFTRQSSKTSPLSESEMHKQLQLQQQSRYLPTEMTRGGGGPSRRNFQMQEEMLLQRQNDEIKQKEEQDKQFILQYQHMYDQNTIQDAFNRRLISSSENISF